MAELTIGFVGAGQMARALARGFVAADLVAANRVLAFDPFDAALEEFAQLIPGSRTAASNQEIAQAADVVILAVKPQVVATALSELSAAGADDTLFISIVAGTPLSALCDGLNTERVIRVMPNTPCLVGAGAAGYSLGPAASTDDGELVGRLLGAVGIAFQVPESQIDAITGLSGSGPAYVYTMIEALSDGGVRAGLPRATANALAAQTVFGAAQMVLATGDHPGVLKDRVTSPGGTTIAGLQVLERQGFRSALIDAVDVAAKRSQELGQS